MDTASSHILEWWLMMKIKLFSLLLVLILSGCAASGGTPATYDNKSITFLVNKAMATAHKKQVRNFGGVENNLSKVRRVNSIVNRLKKTSSFKGKKIIAVVLKSGQVNASSLSSAANIAYVYVTNGMLNFVKNDDELAFVLAHEMAHINAKKHNKTTPKQSITEEMLADKLAAKYMVIAGFNKRSVFKFLQRLEARQASQNISNAQYYPSNTQRINQLF